jgi:VanZ family protein
MSAPMPHAKIWLVTTLVATVILYGSLYPFQFRVPPHDIGPVATFLASIWQRPGRGDALANILLYMPLGFFFVLGFRRGPAQNVGLVLATAIGALLSLSMELTQYYDGGRVTSFSDFYTNTVGALLGALAAKVVGASFRRPLIGEISARPIPTLLLIAWLAYRMYPYVPTIDLHKYWNALKPIALTPSLTGYDLFRQTAIWLAVYALIEACVRRRQSAFLAPLFAVAVLGAKVLVITIILKLSDPLGAGIAYVIWLLLLPARLAAGIVGPVLCGYIVALRLEPFALLPVARDFGWIPFLSLMQGSVEVDTLAFLEKFFLYGAMVYLLGNAVGSRLVAALFAATVLFATSWAEIYLPGRSAEITDGLMALIIAAMFALLPAERGDWRRDRAEATVADGARASASRLAAGAGTRARREAGVTIAADPWSI